jgi:hypothetical protein
MVNFVSNICKLDKNWEFTVSGFSREVTGVLELDMMPQIGAVLATANTHFLNICQISQHHIPGDSNLQSS